MIFGVGAVAMEEQQKPIWEFYEKDNAYFRRPARPYGGCTDVLHGSEWVPYTGDGVAAYLYGDRVEPRQVPNGAGAIAGEAGDGVSI